MSEWRSGKLMAELTHIAATLRPIVKIWGQVVKGGYDLADIIGTLLFKSLMYNYGNIQKWFVVQPHSCGGIGWILSL